MMDMLCASNTARVNPPLTQRPLESLAGSLNRVNIAVGRIGAFVGRFHGLTKEPGPVAGKEDFAPDSYAYMLDRLRDALDHLETRLDELDAIG